MKISIFGLGYVGCVTAACLSKAGHQIWGVDVNPEKVALLQEGKPPIIEEGLAELISAGVDCNLLKATCNSHEAVHDTEVSLVCVGTPSNYNGSLSLDSLKVVTQQIGESLKSKDSHHCVVFRSTVLPGTVRNILIPILADTSGKQIDRDVDVCFNPEFLREGSSIHDFYNPFATIIGHSSLRGAQAVRQLYSGIDAPVVATSYEVSEMLKYACNCYHALKVTFANEIGTLCKSMSVDSYQVMELFALDTKLNLSKTYLAPGASFGGSCLPKDLRALLYAGKSKDLSLPLLSSILESNNLHMDRLIQRIVGTKKKKIGVLGLSFKAGTDDLRESPTVVLVETLIGKGFTVRIYDPEVLLARLFGANKNYIEKEIPHISSLLCSTMQEVLEESEVLVICKKMQNLDTALAPYLSQRLIFDLVRINLGSQKRPELYEGICW
jgi:GDP-mannose 6-dehydrogenase